MACTCSRTRTSSTAVVVGLVKRQTYADAVLRAEQQLRDELDELHVPMTNDPMVDRAREECFDDFCQALRCAAVVVVERRDVEFADGVDHKLDQLRFGVDHKLRVLLVRGAERL